MKMRRRFACFCLILGFAVLMLPAISEAQQKTKVKAGYIVGTPATVFFVGEEKGFFKAAGLDVELIPFLGGPANLQALAAREIQFGSSAGIPFLYYLSKRQDIVGVASVHVSASIGVLSSGWVKSDQLLASGFFVVRADSPIRSVKDLKGKVVAAGNANGTWPELFARKFVKNNGLDAQRDTSWTTLGFELMYGALGQKTVDAAFLWEPFYTLAQDKYKVRTLFTDLDVERGVAPLPGPIPDGNGTITFAHREFLKQNPTIAKAFLKAYRQSMNWTWRNFEEAKKITAKRFNVSQEIASKLVINPGPRDGKVPLQPLKRAHAIMLELGALKAPIKGWPEDHFDFSFLDAVNAELE